MDSTLGKFCQGKPTHLVSGNKYRPATGPKNQQFFFFFFISYIIFEIVFNRVHCITRSHGWCENVRETLCVEYKTTNAKDGV